MPVTKYMTSNDLEAATDVAAVRRRDVAVPGSDILAAILRHNGGMAGSAPGFAIAPPVEPMLAVV